MSDTPTIRFKGFSDDWEQRKVTDLGEIYIGLVTTMTEHYTDKGHLLIRNSDIKDGYFEFGENPIYLDEEFSEQNKSRMHQLGDVITVHTGDIGTSAVIGENEVNSIGFATIVTRPNQEILDSNYFATYLNTDTHKQWAVSMATGDGRSNYNLKDYTKLVVPIPEIEEQKKIAACIVNINSLITLHQQKCNDAKLLKKYMLKKMFPQNGQKVPEIRFSGFTDDWEQRKVCNITTSYSGGTPKSGSTEYYDGDIPFIRSGEIYSDKTELFITELGMKNSSAKMVYEGDILYALYGATSGEISRAKLDGAINQAILAIIPNDDINANFLVEWFRKEKDKITDTYLQGGQGNLSAQIIKELEVTIPSYDEQNKIGLYFEQLNTLITLHQQKCDELKEMKKYMLQNMFPQKG